MHLHLELKRVRFCILSVHVILCFFRSNMMAQLVEHQETDQKAKSKSILDTLIHEHVDKYVAQCTSQLTTQCTTVRIIDNI